MIRAECHSCDHRESARFDATPYFEGAAEREVLRLAEYGWGNARPSWDVVGQVEDLPGYESVETVTAYARGAGDEVACTVHGPDALGWLRDNNPPLHARVCVHLDIDVATPFGNERGPEWDRNQRPDPTYAVHEPTHAPGM